MKHLRTSTYINWLDKFDVSPQINKASLNITGTLKESLLECTTLEEMKAVFEIYLNNDVQPSVSHTLYLKLDAWVREINTIMDAIKSASRVMQHATRTKGNAPILDLVSVLLTHSECHLHVNALSLFTIVCDEEFPQVLKHLEQLKEVSPPDQILNGSFGAVETIDDMHLGCQQLLRNNCADFKENNSLWIKANGLLQSALMMYQDLRDDEPENARVLGI